MSRLELDDQILNHPKFIRARKIGGSEAIDMWLGIRAYVGQNLSNGFVPADMVDEVRGPVGKKRVAALKTLTEVGLLHHVACGRISAPACARCHEVVAQVVPVSGAGILMHDFLQWSRSKSQVIADRERSRDRQAKSRGKSRRDSHSDEPVTTVGVAPASASATTSPPTTTPKPPGVVDPNAMVRCPVPLPVDDATLARLQLDVGMPRGVAEVALRDWATDRAATQEVRRLDTWISWAMTAVRGRWSSDKAAMRAAANPPAESGPPPEPEVKTYADIVAARSKGAA